MLRFSFRPPSPAPARPAERDEIAPDLLAILERVAENPAGYATDESYFGHIFAVFLLAKFREIRAYPLLRRIISEPGETPFDVLGDAVTQNLDSILASVCGGDDAGLKALIFAPLLRLEWHRLRLHRAASLKRPPFPYKRPQCPKCS